MGTFVPNDFEKLQIDTENARGHDPHTRESLMSTLAYI